MPCYASRGLRGYEATAGVGAGARGRAAWVGWGRGAPTKRQRRRSRCARPCRLVSGRAHAGAGDGQGGIRRLGLRLGQDSVGHRAPPLPLPVAAGGPLVGGLEAWVCAAPWLLWTILYRDQALLHRLPTGTVVLLPICYALFVWIVWHSAWTTLRRGDVLSTGGPAQGGALRTRVIQFSEMGLHNIPEGGKEFCPTRSLACPARSA